MDIDETSLSAANLETSFSQIDGRSNRTTKNSSKRPVDYLKIDPEERLKLWALEFSLDHKNELDNYYLVDRAADLILYQTEKLRKSKNLTEEERAEISESIKILAARVFNSKDPDFLKPKVKAALYLAQYFEEFDSKNKDAAREIYAYISRKLDEIKSVQIVDNRDPKNPIPCDINYALRASYLVPGYSTIAKAKYYEKLEETPSNKDAIINAIEDLKDEILSVEKKKREEHRDEGFVTEMNICLEQVYYIIAKLYLAIGEKQKAADIVNMLLGRSQSNPFIGESGDIVKAQIPYFINSCKFLLLKMGMGGNPKNFLGDVSDPYQKITAKYLLANDLISATAVNPQEKKNQNEQAKKLYEEVIHSKAADDITKRYSEINYANLLLSDNNPSAAKEQAMQTLFAKSGTNADIKANASIIIKKADIEIAKQSIKDAKNKDESTVARENLKNQILTSINTFEEIANNQNLSKYIVESAKIELADAYIELQKLLEKNDPKTNELEQKALAIYDFFISGKNNRSDIIFRAKTGKAQVIWEDKPDEAKKLLIETLKENKTDIALQAKAAMILANIEMEDGKPQSKELAKKLISALRNKFNTASIVKINENESVTIFGTEGDKKLSFFTNQATINYHQINLASKNCTNEDIKDAIQELEYISSSETDEFIKSNAKITLAEIYSREKRTHDKASQLFNELKDSKFDFINEKALLGIAILNLSKEHSSKEFLDNLETSLNTVLQAINSNVIETSEKASLALINLLSPIEEFYDVSKAIADRALGNNLESKVSTKQLEESLENFRNNPYYPNEFREKLANILSNNLNAILKVANELKPSTQPYIIAAMHNQKGQVLSFKNGTNTEEAAQNFAQAQNMYETAVNDKLSELQAKAGQITSKFNSFLKKEEIEAAIAGLLSVSKEYQNALQEGIISDPAPYLESQITLGILNLKLKLYSLIKKTDRNKASILSGEIIEGYKNFIDGSYPPEIRTMALTNYSSALNAFGLEKESKQILKVLEESPDYANNRFTSAETIKNMGILSIGDSNPKLAVFYFDEADKRNPSDPTTKIYLARAMYLTERFSAKEFSQKYDEALELMWTKEKKVNKNLGKLKISQQDIVSQALLENGDLFNALKETNNGRAIILTALEADAKKWQAKGDDYKAAVRYEKAIALSQAWQANNQPIENDYLFESQLRYDLASAYLCLNRMYDAYQQYLKIDSLGVAPNWWIEDQLRLLNPETLSITRNDNEDLNIAYRRAFEKGSLQLNFNKDGGTAEGFFFVNPQKTFGVRVRLGAYNHGTYDAGIGAEYNKGKIKANIGVDYSRTKVNEDQENQIIGIKAGVETKLNRHLTIGLKGKVDLHYEDFDYTTWELTAYARYAKKIDWLGKNAVFFANLEATYGKKRVEAGRTKWIDDYKAPQSFESPWMWSQEPSQDGTSEVEYSYTKDIASGEIIRKRYWYQDYVYDQAGLPLTGWHVDTAIEPGKSETKYIINPFDPANQIKVDLARIYKHKCIKTDITGTSWLDGRNSIVTPRGAKPSSSQINSIDVNNITHAEPPKIIYKEEVGQVKQLGTASNYTIIVDIMGRSLNEETNTWEDPKLAYQLIITKTPVGTSIMMKNKNGTKTLYQGHSENEAILKLAEFYRLRGEIGVNKKFHLDKQNITFDTTLSVFGEYENIKDLNLKQNEWANTKDTYRYGLGLGIRASQGPVSVGVDAGIANTNGDWDTYWSVNQTVALSPESSLQSSYGPNGMQGSVKVKNVGVGMDVNGNPNISISTKGIKSSDTQILGETTVGVGKSGLSINGLPVTSFNPTSAAIGSLVMAYNSEKDITKKREIIKELTIELFGSDDPRLSALIRRKIDDQFVALGQNTANWWQDSSRLPIINVLTMIGGNRKAKNEGIIERETKELLATLSTLKENGAFEWLENDSDDMPQNDLLIKSYANNSAVIINREKLLKKVSITDDLLQMLFINPEDKDLIFNPDFEKILPNLEIQDKEKKALLDIYKDAKESIEEKDGIFRKIADTQSKIVNTIFFPLKEIGKGIGIINPKSPAGKVSPRDFNKVGKKTSKVWQDLINSGYIDEKGLVKQNERIGIVNLDSTEYSLTEKYAITEVLNESIERKIISETDIDQLKNSSAKQFENVEELRSAFYDKLFEDTMYLIYRLIDKNGNTPQTRAQIGQVLSSLPDSLKEKIEHFINQFPAEYLAELNSGIKVALPKDKKTMKEKSVIIEAEVFAKEALEKQSSFERLALEDKVLQRIKETKEKDLINLSKTLYSELNNAIKAGDINGVYSSAVGLISIAGTSPANAGMISEMIGNEESQDFAQISKTLAQIREKLTDFAMNRMPNSHKLFGRKKDKIYVEGNWGKDAKPIKASFGIEEFVAALINGKVKQQAVLKNSRSVSIKDFRGIMDDSELESLWNLLINKGYINQNGIIMQETRTLKAENLDLPYDISIKEKILAVMTKDKTSTKPGYIANSSINKIKGEIRKDKNREKDVHDMNTGQEEDPSKLMTPMFPKEQNKGKTQRKINENKPPVELVDKNKEAEKAARKERIRKAQEKYGVGPYRK